MTMDEYGFYFERSQRGVTQGPIAASEQYFQGSETESLVRELAQNSIDARAGREPVKMVFHLRAVPTSEIPDLATIRSHAERAVEFVSKMADQNRIRRVVELASQESVPVLRVSDYGTTGLTGSESLEDQSSPLVALTRGAGVSDTSSSRGGSFGIGSAVGLLVSGLRTVLYTSRVEGGEQTVFAGHCRLASHRDDEGRIRAADGFFTKLAEQDFSYWRGDIHIDGFAPRAEAGTDTYLMGYNQSDDVQLEGVRDAFVDHFLVAIHRGELLVEGWVEGKCEWALSSETLPAYAESRPEARAFLRALQDPDPYVEDVRGLGELRLYTYVDDRLERKLHTLAVRRPLMRIRTFRHNSVRLKYAAVVDCSAPTANAKLRELEPPEHNNWVPGRAEHGSRTLKAVTEFVRRGLMTRVVQTSGESVEIEGLAAVLPLELSTTKESGEGKVPGLGDGAAEESSSVQGEPKKDLNLKPKFEKVVRLPVRIPGVSGGDQGAERGKLRGGKGAKRTSGTVGIPDGASPGAGGSQIPAEDVSVRAWMADGGTWRLRVRPAANHYGDLRLSALGVDDEPISDLILGIAEAWRIDGGVRTKLTVSGNSLKGLVLDEGEILDLEIRLESGRRYKLGVI